MGTVMQRLSTIQRTTRRQLLRFLKMAKAKEIPEPSPKPRVRINRKIRIPSAVRVNKH